jgi:tetratricopeptide (TPR) repeat protein
VGALEELTRAVTLAPDYAEAYREKGIAENKLHPESGTGPSGEDSLRKAVSLNPEDFDALASLGGVLKRKGALDEALEAYEQSTRVSHGHSYPLLNAVKLQAAAAGELEIDAKTRLMLKRAERSRAAQVKNEPPYDAPWSFFDLAEIRLYLADETGFLENIREGIVISEHSWQPETCRKSLALLVEAGIDLPGLQQGLAELDEAVELLKENEQ